MMMNEWQLAIGVTNQVPGKNALPHQTVTSLSNAHLSCGPYGRTGVDVVQVALEAHVVNKYEPSLGHDAGGRSVPDALDGNPGTKLKTVGHSQEEPSAIEARTGHDGVNGKTRRG